MSKLLVSDALWILIAPFLPPERPKPSGGRPRSIPDRAVLSGILFVLKSVIPSRDVAAGDGLWQWDDLLATAARLAASWGLEASASCPVAAATGRRTDRLGTGHT